MTNEIILRAFMQKVWNQKDVNSIAEFVHDEYTIHIDTGDPWEGKTLNHSEFETRLNHSFSSFPDIHFAIQQSISDGDYVAITWMAQCINFYRKLKWSILYRFFNRIESHHTSLLEV